MNYNTVLFDLDGTLIDPYEGISNTILHVLEQFGDEKLSSEVLVKFIGPPLIEGFKMFAGYDDKKARKALEIYRESYIKKGVYEATLTEGVRPLLAALSKAGVRLGVATSKPDIMTEIILKHFSVYDYFEFISAAELSPDGRNEKSPIIAYALENMKISGDELKKTVIIGDRHHDVSGAKDNGIACVGLLSGFGNRAEFADADYIIDEIAELEKIVLA
ncbi:MAG: HAD hydrolase-like protein [Oscillospiraceae bacterium]|nr:HAD hydrolase-like protein [Oscillospiraceae bacterium]